ncbi:MAG: HlyC/CorC family transporter [Melioribacteraceae bacterium]|nr:HlyC/CorC family transporter [Melioribacteraceae bacterium]
MSEMLFILIILLLLSGFFSSSEIAFVISNKLKIELRARKNNLAARIVSFFIEKPQVFFSTILISNNIVNITFASLITIFLHKIYGFSDGVILTISTLVLLIFGELIPKYFAREHPDSMIIFSSIPIRIISFLLYPFVKITSYISTIIVSSANINEERISLLFEREDIQSLLHESTSMGTIDEEESDVINKVISLGEQKVYEIITPRTDIVGLDINSSIKDAINTFSESGYSKLPVYEENIDNIKGFIHALDMFKFPASIKETLREIMFFPETKKSLELLNEFLDNQTSIAVVIDEFGGTAGIVTIEDIIEEMLGEIRDEYDPDEELCKKLSDGTYIISGKVEIDYIKEEFDIDIPEGDYETIAGYVISSLGFIPPVGKYYTIDNFRVQVIRSSKTRLELIKLFVEKK